MQADLTLAAYKIPPSVGARLLHATTFDLHHEEDVAYGIGSKRSQVVVKPAVTVVGLVLQVGDAEKSPQVLNRGNLDPFLRVSDTSTAIEM